MNLACSLNSYSPAVPAHVVLGWWWLRFNICLNLVSSPSASLLLDQDVAPAWGGMSNRDSLGVGDLLPQDVVHVFAQEKHSKRGRKKRRHSIGRALGWLKGRKRKNLGANGQNLGPGPAFDLAMDTHPAGQRSGRHAHPHGNSHGKNTQDLLCSFSFISDWVCT